MRCLLLLLALAWAAPRSAAAQEKAAAPATDKAGKGKKGAGKERFFDFEGLVIDGELRKPGAFFASAREKVRFDRLLRLRKSFLQEVEKSAQDPTLKTK